VQGEIDELNGIGSIDDPSEIPWIIDLVEGKILSDFHVFTDRIGHLTDERRRHMGSIQFLQL
jgi:hypothetical protein